MADYDNPVLRGRSDARADAIDQGLRTYMISVYNYMALGVALTGLVAYATYAIPSIFAAIYGTPLVWVVILAPLGLVLLMSFGINRMSAATAQLVFWLFAGLMGLSTAYIFQVYVAADIVRVFFITAAAFGALSLYGYTTPRSLSAMGSFLFMGLVGIVIASLVNLFLASSALTFAISVIGVLVFAGLTAYDTQKIKEMYLESDDREVMGKKAIMGALALYLDFINLFLMLLRLFGSSRD